MFLNRFTGITMDHPETFQGHGTKKSPKTLLTKVAKGSSVYAGVGKGISRTLTGRIPPEADGWNGHGHPIAANEELSHHDANFCSEKNLQR